MKKQTEFQDTKGQNIKIHLSSTGIPSDIWMIVESSSLVNIKLLLSHNQAKMLVDTLNDFLDSEE